MHGRARCHRLVVTGIRHRDRVDGRDRDARRCGVEGAVVDDQLRDIGARLIGHEGRRGRGWIVESRGARRRPRRDRPAERQRIAVRIAGRAAVEMHNRSHRNGLRVAGPAHGSLVPSPNSDGVWRAVDCPVIHDQLRNVGTGFVQRERRIHCRRIRQRCSTYRQAWSSATTRTSADCHRRPWIGCRLAARHRQSTQPDRRRRWPRASNSASSRSPYRAGCQSCRR